MNKPDPYQFSHLDAGEAESTIRAFFRFYWIDWLGSPIRHHALEEASGLPRSAQIILQRLFQEGTMTTTNLAAGLMLDRSTISRQLRPLKAAGLVNAAHVGGGRRTELTLTDAGRDLAVRIDGFVMRDYGEALGRLSPDRVTLLASLLDELRTAMTADVVAPDKAD
jgi:DNA-binding MarR family transcriptional regulator